MLRRTALADPDPLQAMLGASAADNWGLARRISRELQEEADEAGSLLDTVAVHSGALLSMLQLDRQADRFLQFHHVRQAAMHTKLSAAAEMLTAS